MGSSPTGVNAESFEFEFLVDRSHRNEMWQSPRHCCFMRERELSSLWFGLADPSGFHPVKLRPEIPRDLSEVPRDLPVIPRDRSLWFVL